MITARPPRFVMATDIENFIEIAAIDGLHVPIEGLKLLLQRLKRVDLVQGPVHLKMVIIHKSTDAVTFCVSQESGSPNI